MRRGSGRFSLAGAQAKIALRRTDAGWALPFGREPTTHILKPAIPDLPEQDLNEHLTMRTAAALAFPVARTQLRTISGTRALVVERYDRIVVDGEVLRIHQEDLLQALGRAPITKYETDGGPGLVSLASLVRQHVTAPYARSDVRDLVASAAFNWLVGGTDAHAKNLALLLAPGQVRLAPLYDLNSFLPYTSGTDLALSMAVGPLRRYRCGEIDADDWRWTARNCGLDPDGLLTELTTLARELPDAAREAATEALTDGSVDDVTPAVRAFAARFVDVLAAHGAACLTRLVT